MTQPRDFEPAVFADLAGWAADDHMAAFRAYCGSAEAVIAMAARRGGVPEVAAVIAASALANEARIQSNQQAQAFFETHFRPVRAVSDTPGLLTGYYEPVIEGSLSPTSRFTVPVYRRPPDLENVVAESERGATREVLTHVRRIPSRDGCAAGSIEPYATRADIERGALAGLGLELCYLADPVETFFLHIQGSGAIRLPDGRLQRITYDGKNGHPYISIGRTLIEEGAFAADGLTLQVLGAWLRADPDRARAVMWRNASFVFFRALVGESPIGVMGSALHPGRSMAIDTAFHALGLPIHVSAPGMGHVAPGGFHRLMITHDVGSAIKGPQRGDVYFGTGPDALALAGITRHAGQFHVLQPVAAL